MIHDITVLDDGTTRIDVSFSDEGVDLQGTTSVRGGQAEAERYLPVYESDLRTNYADLFPAPPEPEAHPEVEI
jgi:hypothetical protein